MWAVSPTREQLYAEVWSQPITAVARRYGVSNVYLARVCDELRVPKPPRGFWQRREAGLDPVVPPLPPARPGDRSTWRIDSGAKGLVEAPSIGRSGRSRLPAEHGSHPLVVEARDAYSQRRNPTDSGYIVPKKYNLMDLLVTDATLARALEVADLLFGELERLGHRVVLTNGHADRPKGDLMQELWRNAHAHRRATVTFVGDTAFGLKLVEIGGTA
jgi:hypothetical protein